MDKELSDQIRPGITVGASHLFLLIVIIVFYTVRVPHYGEVYQDLGAQLPRVTIMVLGLGQWIVQHWYWLVPPLVLLLAVDVFTFMHVRKCTNESFARVWAWAVIGLLGVLLVGSWLAVRLPLARLTRGMA